MPEWTLDTLKEHFEHKFEAQEALFEARLNRLDSETCKQAKEYERRLTELNHAHARAVEVLATYLPREHFDVFLQQTNDHRSDVERRLNLAEGRTTGFAANLGTGLSLLAILLSMASTVIMFMTRH